MSSVPLLAISADNTTSTDISRVLVIKNIIHIIIIGDSFSIDGNNNVPEQYAPKLIERRSPYSSFFRWRTLIHLPYQNALDSKSPRYVILEYDDAYAGLNGLPILNNLIYDSIDRIRRYRKTDACGVSQYGSIHSN